MQDFVNMLGGLIAIAFVIVINHIFIKMVKDYVSDRNEKRTQQRPEASRQANSAPASSSSGEQAIIPDRKEQEPQQRPCGRVNHAHDETCTCGRSKREAFLASVKDRIEALAPKETNQSLADFNWGIHDTTPAACGVVFIEDGWYTYQNGDDGESIFSGPIEDKELLGYLRGALLGLNPQEENLGNERFFEIAHSQYNGMDAVLENIKNHEEVVS